MTEISLKDISKVFKTVKVTALTDVSLEVEKGEFFCLVGPSGCGKSTILRIISGLEKPSSGEVQAPKEISMVFQSGALLPWMNVEENISFVCKANGMSDLKAEEQTTKYLRMVDLEGFRYRYPRELSGGQRQRVGIARALAIEPTVLLLDEPFSALDPITTDELHTYLLKIWKETQKTIVMVSHMLEEAILLSNRIGIMKKGEIKQIMEIKLKRPRSQGSNEFLKTLEEVKKVLIG